RAWLFSLEIGEGSVVFLVVCVVFVVGCGEFFGVLRVLLTVLGVWVFVAVSFFGVVVFRSWCLCLVVVVFLCVFVVSLAAVVLVFRLFVFLLLGVVVFLVFLFCGFWVVFCLGGVLVVGVCLGLGLVVLFVVVLLFGGGVVVCVLVVVFVVFLFFLLWLLFLGGVVLVGVLWV
ncbi:hypothetical protein, partial [Neisseria sp. P0024.S006]|uniref:hypothetical protein n=1 Tax=Neisseria sp. P0024.S006 TaxID=3436850 RepID=UPI003F7F9239